jgi:hypothetical protein
MLNKKPTQFYTEDERIRRVWDIEDIKDLMSRRGFYQANDWRREELNDLWVTTPRYQQTASLGSNRGYYFGMDEISNFYVVQYFKKRQKLLDAYCTAHPEVENRRENLGYGCMVYHPASTPLVILSGDGQTARGLWYVIGQETVWQPDGPPDCRWYNDKLAADFVKEKTGWKLWHLVISNDFHVAAGRNLNEMPTIPVPGDNPAEAAFLEGEPTIRMLTHNTSMNWSDNYPPIPEPYFRFDTAASYAPQGHPDYPEEG